MKKSLAIPIVFTIVLLSVSYAVFRYHVAGPVPWEDLTLFVLNKGLGLAALFLLTLSFAINPLRRLGVSIPTYLNSVKKDVGVAGLLLAVLHVLVSFLLWSPATYAQFFDCDGTVTFLAGLGMLSGVSAFALLYWYNSRFQTNLSRDSKPSRIVISRRFVFAAMSLGAAHSFFLGFSGWLSIDRWHGGMPPISLVAFIVAATGIMINLLGRK